VSIPVLVSRQYRLQLVIIVHRHTLDCDDPNIEVLLARFYPPVAL
jgi:hypothetical protein